MLENRKHFHKSLKCFLRDIALQILRLKKKITSFIGIRLKGIYTFIEKSEKMLFLP